MAHIAPLQIGPYLIFDEIGRGGMSIVYRARDSRDSRIVALKVLPPEFHDQDQLLSRFVKEGQSTLRLVHPNIVRTFEADLAKAADNKDTYYIAMEFVQGQNLSEYLKQHPGPLPFDEAIRILRQVALGLDYAHSQGILHRDIKPSNILLNQDGRAQITDFGVARDLSADNTLVTMPGHSIGTPSYMSPEQARGDQDVDSRSDIYSLGVVAYAMLTGKMPFEASSHLSLLRKIIDDAPTAPEVINPQLNQGVAGALRNVLAKDPQARYATAATFVAALEAGNTAGTTAQRQPISDATVPDLVVATAAASSSDATVSVRQPSSPRPKGNALLAAAARSGRHPSSASSKSLPRQYVLKTTSVKRGKGRRLNAYVLGAALLMVVVLVTFLLIDRFTRPAQIDNSAVALVTTPPSDTPTPPPSTPSPVPTDSEDSSEAGSITGAVVVSDSALLSDSGSDPTATQVAQEEGDSTPTEEPTLGSATAKAHIVSAPAVPAKPAPPTSTPTEALPTEALPTETLPTEALPTEALPTEALPTEALPTEALPTEALPTEALPTEALPTEALPTGALPTPLPTTAKAVSVVTPPPPTSTEAVALPTITPSPVTPTAATPTPGLVDASADDAPEPGATRVNDVDGAVYLNIPAGKFSMGSTRADDEKPIHAVEINAFWIMQTEVTNAQYALCVAGGDCTPPLNERLDDPNYANHPVVNINWSQANEYAGWAGGRLPTEAEWEKAARGDDLRPFPWGDNAPDETLLNFDSTINDTTPVANYLLGASPYGLYDMAGNVEEWVEDWYASDYYTASPAQNPLGPTDGIFRVVRGGSYHSNANLVLATTRGKAAPNRGYSSVGFRVVLDK